MSAHLRLSPYDVYMDPLLDIQDRRLKDLLAYWNAKRGIRPMPARADVSPADIIGHLPSIFLVNTEPPAVSPPHFRVRLMGTALNELFARDFTGRTIETSASGESAAAIAKVLGIMCALRRPLRIHGQAAFMADRESIEMEAICLPLSSDGKQVDMAMGELVRRASADAA